MHLNIMFLISILRLFLHNYIHVLGNVQFSVLINFNTYLMMRNLPIIHKERRPNWYVHCHVVIIRILNYRFNLFLNGTIPQIYTPLLHVRKHLSKQLSHFSLLYF